LNISESELIKVDDFSRSSEEVELLELVERRNLVVKGTLSILNQHDPIERPIYDSETDEEILEIITPYNQERNFQFSLGIELHDWDDYHNRLIEQYPGLKGHSTEFILSFHKYRLESRIIKIVKQVSEDAFDEARNFDYNKEYLPDKYENKKGF